jgi:hypothetical protein
VVESHLTALHCLIGFHLFERGSWALVSPENGEILNNSSFDTSAMLVFHSIRKPMKMDQQMLSASIRYVPKTLQPGQFKDAIEQAVAAVLGNKATIEVSHTIHEVWE